jgi:CheY-like chemotaxis protein
VIENFAALLKETFNKTIDINLDLDKGVPAIRGDENQFRQILLNLCLNSRDAMPEGGRISIMTETVSREELRRRIFEVEAARYVSISVTDTGCGMDAATQQRIFEPFFTTKPKDRGTGLGLAVVYGIVKNHDGFIEVKSETGCGTTVCIYFPVPDVAAEAISVAAPIVTTPKCENGGETILIVDDEPPQLDLMLRLLKREGYKVFGAKDGIEAVEVFKRHKDVIALAVMDLGLPKLNGWQALEQMRKIRPALKALIASGFVAADVKAEIEQAGLGEVISKPYRLDEVLEKISQAVQRSRIG